MVCRQCGNNLPDGSNFCDRCGANQNAANINPQADDNVNPQEMLQKYSKQIASTAIVGYVCAAASLIAALFVSKNLFNIIDVMIVLLTSLGIHLKKSMVCAIILTIYSLINMIVSIVSTGKLGGYLILIAGVLAIYYISKYKNLLKTIQR